MKQITSFVTLLIVWLAPVTVFGQAVGQRTSVGYLNSGYGFGYRGFGGFGYGFNGRLWGGTYGDLLNQQPTQYLDYQKPVYRGGASSAEIAQQMYNASYDAYGGRLHRTEAFAERVMNARVHAGLPANVISSAPVNDSLWLADKPEHSHITPAPVVAFEPLIEPATPSSSPHPMHNQNAVAQSDDPRSHAMPSESARESPRDQRIAEEEQHSPTALLVRPNTPASVNTDQPQQQANATLAGMAVGRGDAAFQRGAYAEAREHYLRATVALPEEAGPHIAHGLACFALGDLAAAARSLRTGCGHAPDLAYAEIDLRDLYGNAADFSRQLARLDEHLAARPDHSDAWFVKGFVSHYTSNAVAARMAFDRYRKQVSEDLLADEFIDRVLADRDANAAAE